jgi:peptidoglycan/LPS O-acetylase OafA/YrhL
MVAINNPVSSTWIIGLVLLCLLAFSARPKKPGSLFSPAVTNELKGAAILMVVFAHIGYFLSNNPRFLWPLSILAGVGVNIFLFLSAYGLSLSNTKKQLGIWLWYKKRLPKLYISLWIVLVIFFLMDYLILGRSYSFQYIWHSMIGFFPRADAYKDLDSPLWYFTLLVFYYLLFPLFFIRKHLWISGILLLVCGKLFISWSSIASPDLLKLYSIHYVAFPLGVLAAWTFSTATASKLKQKFSMYMHDSTLKYSTDPIGGILTPASYYLLLITLMVMIGYLAVHSGIGQSPHKEQFISLCTMALIIIVFIIKKVEFRLLTLFRAFSYAIYLLHWPILSRYEILYSHMPAWMATLIWLGIFVMLGWLLSFVPGNFKQNQSSKS